MAGSADNFYLDTQKMTEKVNKLANFKDKLNSFSSELNKLPDHPNWYLFHSSVDGMRESMKAKLTKGAEEINSTLDIMAKSLALYCEEVSQYDQLKVTRK